MLNALQFGNAETRPDVEYGRAGNFSLRMDANIPGWQGAVPSGRDRTWGRLDWRQPRYNVEPLFRPLTQAGFAWFSISYRLASELPLFGAAIDDVQEAVRHVKSHAKQYNIDPARIALIGESAGAQLASMAALTADEAASVNAVVSFYNPSDLVSLARNSSMIPQAIRQPFKAARGLSCC
jgi:Esterase/lipase